MNEKENAAWQDCIELFEDTMDHLNVCLSNESDKKYIPNWLSAALTNQDTCLNGFRDLNVTATSNIKDLILSRALNVSELVSNSLSIYKYFSLSANTLKNRRLMSLDRQEDFQSHYGNTEEDGFPEWLSAGDRRLLQSSSPASQANVVVAQDGSGNYRTITQAVGIGDRLLVGATVHTAAAGGMSPDTRQRQEAWAQNSWLPCSACNLPLGNGIKI